MRMFLSRSVLDSIYHVVVYECGNRAGCDLLLLVHQVIYKTPVPTGDVYFAETFDDGSLERYSWKTALKPITAFPNFQILLSW